MTESKARRAERLGQVLPERICSGGCGKSLNGRDARAKYCHECIMKRTGSRDRLKATKRRSLLELVNRASIDSGYRVVSNLGHHKPKKAEIICKECMSMSWRRKAWCPGCNLCYAPEPPPDRLETLRSSAGALVVEGRLHGYAGKGGGHHGNKK